MTRIMDCLSGPEDLKELDDSALNALAQELRDEIINTVAATGGHLAPNLGVVELTLALHRVFDSPRDRIVWDVGHQCYVHKLVTGRRDLFHTLRQYGGISGFPLPTESEHDAFATGHSSTSISVGLGMAKARDLKGEDYSVVCVIGDGSMTGGLAFEGLNHAGHLKTDLIVVLNDNEMSISPNVGALASCLTRIRLNPRVVRIKEDIEELIRRIPAIGSTMSDLITRLKGSIKYLVVPAMFEEFGFTYMGPVKGHDIAGLTRSLSDARRRGGPVLVHVATTKGKGYRHAESKPAIYHSIGPFEPMTGKPIEPSGGDEPTFTQAFGDALVQLSSESDDIVAITAAMTAGTGLERFAAEYPSRFFDVGIAESHAVTFAAGLAKEGFRPVVAIYSSFLQRAYDQIVHDVCVLGLPVVFAVDRAGIVGEDGLTHQGIFDVSFLRNIPNMTLLAPRDHKELAAMLKFALASCRPVAIRYPKGTSPSPRREQREPVVRGCSEILVHGTDIALIALGSMTPVAEAAASQLSECGVSCTVIDARFVSPIDCRVISDIASTGAPIVTLEEGCVEGGFGSAVAQIVAQLPQAEKAPVLNLGIPNAFVEHGSRDRLLRELGLDPEGVVARIRTLLADPNLETASSSGSVSPRVEGEKIGQGTS